MPRISAFYGIVVFMYYRDHPPPHVHAIYAEHVAQVMIDTGDLLEGELPRRAARLVEEWRALRVGELRADWHLARVGRPLNPIDPLG